MGSRGPVNDYGGVALQQRNDSIITAVIISKEVLPKSRLVEVTSHTKSHEFSGACCKRAALDAAIRATVPSPCNMADRVVQISG